MLITIMIIRTIITIIAIIIIMMIIIIITIMIITTIITIMIMCLEGMGSLSFFSTGSCLNGWGICTVRIPTPLHVKKDAPYPICPGG